MPRTFIAVSASPELKAAAQKLMAKLAPVAGDVRWVPPENLHWTLQFLGEVETLETPSLCAAVAMAVAEVEAFHLECRGAGAFPAPDRPRTLWIGAGRGTQQMEALHSTIQKQLDRRGFRSEQRRYVPHLTIGRTSGKSPPHSLTRELGALTDFDAGTMLVDEVTIYESRLSRDGSTYDVLAHAPLA